MKKGQEYKQSYDDLIIYHQNFPKKQLGLHSHSQAHLFIPLKGDIWLIFEDQKVRVPPGKMLFIPSGTLHGFDSSELQGERIIVMLKPVKHDRPFSLMPTNKLIEQTLFHLIVSKDQKSSLPAKKLFYLHLKEVLEGGEPLNIDQVLVKAKDQRLMTALKLMEKNLDFKISDIAKKSGSSAKTLTRLFQNELGLGPKQVQSMFRIDSALVLLKSGKYSVTQVAFEVGFSSLSQFIANFRHFTGKLPSQV